MLFSEPKIPQSTHTAICQAPISRFSALQRAENSSIDDEKIQAGDIKFKFQCSSASRKFLNPRAAPRDAAQRAFQCSSASRKFLNVGARPRARRGVWVSVLFSEPKIPQSDASPPRADRKEFQCSSASRKFLNLNESIGSDTVLLSFSALQRAENSSILYKESRLFTSKHRFSALQRAENSSIPTLAPASIHISDRDDHASSFLSLPGASP